MVDPKYFLKQSQFDMAACDLLYKAGNYGNAAYHLQQAVEKHTKYILSHGGLMPKRNTHLPVEFLEEFISEIYNFKDLAEKHKMYFFDDESSRERREQFLDQSRIIMKGLTEGKASFRNALWKNSLGIPLVDEQEKAVFKKCPIFLRYTKRKITMVRGWLNETDKFNFDNDPVIKKLYYYKTPVELGPTIAATFPHVEVGRYPTDINTTKGLKNSVELYEEHKNELGELIESVEKTLLSS